MGAHGQHSTTISTLVDLANRYPPELREAQLRDVPRIAFHLELALGVGGSPVGRRICDIGGGIGLFSLGCAALGFRPVVLVDDFGDEINRRVGESVLDLHREYGVQVVSRDVIRDGLGELQGPMDVVTSFDSMEHWHHSPKQVFHSALALLTAGGLFVLGVPNCVNLRKRWSALLGRASWSAMADWYEPAVFRGHVREPSVGDLRYIADDLGLGERVILGRNWLGYRARNRVLRFATALFDQPLRLLPSLCSDIYLVGRKPGGSIDGPHSAAAAGINRRRPLVADAISRHHR